MTRPRTIIGKILSAGSVTASDKAVICHRDASDETVSKLLAAIDDPRDLAIFTLMVRAGLRVDEVVKLQLSDLQPVDSTGLARLRVCGKGDKDRVVWLTPEACNQVQNWLQARPHVEGAYMFLDQHGRLLSVAGVQFRLKQHCERAGVHLTCHQLRHTFARRLAEQGMPIDSLARLLGHSDLQTTQRYIDGADPTVRADFLKAMQDLDQRLQLVSQLPEQKASEHFVPPSSPSLLEQRPDPVELVDSLTIWRLICLRGYNRKYERIPFAVLRAGNRTG